MLPALRRFFLIVTACFVAHLFAISAFTQAPAKLLATNTGVFRTSNGAVADPSLEELNSLGAQGQTIQQARAEVLLILGGENACSAWYRGAEPDVAEKFRSLRFAVDSGGASEILKLANWNDDPYYYQPYVARTGQNVGWGSTIALNANGAFFKSVAAVRVVNKLKDPGFINSSRPLVVGRYSGATLQARILTMLHEYGHVLDMLPIDAGVPSGPLISTRNTDTVLRHCMPQIQAQVKHSRKKTSEIFPAQASLTLRATPNHPGAFRQQRNQFFISRGESDLPPRFE